MISQTWNASSRSIMSSLGLSSQLATQPWGENARIQDEVVAFELMEELPGGTPMAQDRRSSRRAGTVRA